MNTETLDALKTVWKEIDSPTTPAPSLRDLERLWKVRNRNMVIRFVAELILYLAIYTGAIVIIVSTASTEGRMFGIKIVALNLIFFAPVGISLYQALAFARHGDVAISITACLRSSIQKLNRAKRLYVRHSYLFSVFMVVMLLTDSYFSGQSLLLKGCVFAFIGVTAILVKPALDVTFGRDIRHFENLLKEMER
jgi:hypothetical protein